MDAPGTRTVYIDGYNVLLRHVPWQGLPLRAARTRLESLVEQFRWPVPVGRVVLVFDGREAHTPAAAHRRGRLEVRFAPSADAVLQEAIRTSRHPERLIVVTDDAEILRTARSHGARCEATRWLLAAGRPAQARGSTPQSREGRADLPAGAARRINEELAKRWLGKR